MLHNSVTTAAPLFTLHKATATCDGILICKGKTFFLGSSFVTFAQSRAWYICWCRLPAPQMMVEVNQRTTETWRWRWPLVAAWMASLTGWRPKWKARSIRRTIPSGKPTYEDESESLPGCNANTLSFWKISVLWEINRWRCPEFVAMLKN